MYEIGQTRNRITPLTSARTREIPGISVGVGVERLSNPVQIVAGMLMMKVSIAMNQITVASRRTRGF